MGSGQPDLGWESLHRIEPPVHRRSALSRKLDPNHRRRIQGAIARHWPGSMTSGARAPGPARFASSLALTRIIYTVDDDVLLVVVVGLDIDATF